MKAYILFCFVCVLGENVTNNTLPMNNDLVVDESFYTVDVLLAADGVLTQKLG
jgi:hypothetical protein